MAARPAAARRRFRAPDAAVPRPGHVLGPARRRQPGLEAARRDHAAKRRSALLDTYEIRTHASTCAPSSSLRSSSAASFKPPTRNGPVSATANLIANPTMLRPITPRLGPGLHGDAPPPAGARAAQPRLADGTRLDDRVGYRFAVLATRRLVEALPGASARSRSPMAASRWFSPTAKPPTISPASASRRSSFARTGTSSAWRRRLPELAAVLARRPPRLHPPTLSRARCGTPLPHETGRFAMTVSRVPTNAVDHVGSLKRPPELVQTWRDWEAGKARLRRAAPKCRTAPFAMPSTCRRSSGLPVVTDGEFRRGGWSRGFLKRRRRLRFPRLETHFPQR